MNRSEKLRLASEDLREEDIHKDFEWNICPGHGDEYNKYCCRCKIPLCEMCSKNHNDHIILPAWEFMCKMIAHPPSQNHLNMLLPPLQEMVSAAEAIKIEKENEYNHTNTIENKNDLVMAGARLKRIKRVVRAIRENDINICMRALFLIGGINKNIINSLVVNVKEEEIKYNTCFIHGEAISFYCHDCEKYICSFCSLGHVGHTVENIKKYIMNKNILNDSVKEPFMMFAKSINQRAQDKLKKIRDDYEHEMSKLNLLALREEIVYIEQLKLMSSSFDNMNDEKKEAFLLMGSKLLMNIDEDIVNTKLNKLMYDSCPIHGERIIMYCTDCEEYFCWKCWMRHMDHNNENIEKYIENNSLDILQRERIIILILHMKNEITRLDSGLQEIQAEYEKNKTPAIIQKIMKIVITKKRLEKVLENIDKEDCKLPLLLFIDIIIYISQYPVSIYGMPYDTCYIHGAALIFHCTKCDRLHCLYCALSQEGHEHEDINEFIDRKKNHLPDGNTLRNLMPYIKTALHNGVVLKDGHVDEYYRINMYEKKCGNTVNGYEYDGDARKILSRNLSRVISSQLEGAYNFLTDVPNSSITPLVLLKHAVDVGSELVNNIIPENCFDDKEVDVDEVKHKTWMMCPIHNEQCSIICCVCNKFKCLKCDGCEGHKWMTFEEYIEANKKRLPGENEYEKLLNFIRVREEKLGEQAFKIQELIKELKKKMKIAKTLNDNIDIIKYEGNPDEVLTTEAYIFLTSFLERAKTNTQRDFWKNIIEKYDKVCLKTDNEIDSSSEELARLKLEYKKIKIEYKELCFGFKQCRYLRNKLKMEKIDKHIKLLLIRMTNFLRDLKIDWFEAFGCVQSVFDIEEVMKQPLEDVGGGIMMSRPVDVRVKLKIGDINTTNISHKGIIAILNNYNYDRRDVYIQLTNLLTKQQVELKIENWTSIAFYDDNIIMMTNSYHMREAPVNDLFNAPSTKTLKVIGYVILENCPPNTLTHQTRTVYYRNYDYELYEYDVDKKYNNNIELECKVEDISSFGGINMGVKCVFRSKDENKIYALNIDNSVEYICDGYEDYGYFTNVFLSSSNTADLSKALYRMDGKFIYKSKETIPKCLVKFNAYYTIVRLYKDVFLAYDEDEEQWKLVRISIP